MNTSSRTLVAIHQPNFFPWLGFFDKVSRSDIFILMDNAQFPKGDDGNWVNRVKMVVQGRAAWVTIPVSRTYHGTRSIKEIKIDSNPRWMKKLLKTLHLNYTRAPHGGIVFPLLDELLTNPTDSLAYYNVSAIRALTEVLCLDSSKFVLGSTLNVNDYTTDIVTRVISMIKAVGGTAFLCGGGAAYLCGGMGGYPKNERFADAGIELIYQNFQHPIYPQCNTQNFLPGLSIMDVLLNCGFKGTKELITMSTGELC